MKIEVQIAGVSQPPACPVEASVRRRMAEAQLGIGFLMSLNEWN
jgi:hypothetical protein